MAEDDFYDWLTNVTRAAHRRHQARDLSGLVKNFRQLKAMRTKASHDPQLATLETATAQCVLMLADLHADELLFEECAKLCEDAKDILDAKAARFRAAGRQPRPDSPAWCHLITVLGDSKWKGPQWIENAVLTPQEMVTVYYRVESSIRAGLDAQPPARSEAADLLESLMWGGVAVLRTTMRFAPSLVNPLRNAIANWHGTILDDDQHPSYWDLVVTNLYVSGCTDRRAYAQAASHSVETLLKLKGAQFSASAWKARIRKEVPHLAGTALQVHRLSTGHC